MFFIVEKFVLRQRVNLVNGKVKFVDIDTFTHHHLAWEAFDTAIEKVDDKTSLSLVKVKEMVVSEINKKPLEKGKNK